jgi:hypothetical protein
MGVSLKIKGSGYGKGSDARFSTTMNGALSFWFTVHRFPPRAGFNMSFATEIFA